jgi:hypothetical protein
MSQVPFEQRACVPSQQMQLHALVHGIVLPDPVSLAGMQHCCEAASPGTTH